jgi:hypothetical protein
LKHALQKLARKRQLRLAGLQIQLPIEKNEPQVYVKEGGKTHPKPCVEVAVAPFRTWTAPRALCPKVFCTASDKQMVNIKKLKKPHPKTFWCIASSCCLPGPSGSTITCCRTFAGISCNENY